VSVTPEPTSCRVELVLLKPKLGWFPKPTVVIDGRGHPAQWGAGTWQLPNEGTAKIGVYLFNRLWRYGVAEYRLGDGVPSRITYRAPWLPVLRGRISGD
jgi:hypothetical protein